MIADYVWNLDKVIVQHGLPSALLLIDFHLVVKVGNERGGYLSRLIYLLLQLLQFTDLLLKGFDYQGFGTRGDSPETGHRQTGMEENIWFEAVNPTA